jgi:hypothetical protein
MKKPLVLSSLRSRRIEGRPSIRPGFARATQDERISLAVLLISLLPLACAAGRAAVGGPPGEDYGAAVEHWTASAQLYSRSDFVDMTVDVWATYQSPAFRETRVRHWGELTGLAASEITQKLADEQGEAKTELDFFVGMTVDPQKANDLDTRKSIWHVALLLPDGSALAPLSIRAFDPPDANQRQLYPYVRDSWIGYWIRFPALNALGQPVLQGADKITLHLGSALGKVDLAFALGTSGDQAPRPLASSTPASGP